MNDIKTVYCNGCGLKVHQSVLDDMGLTPYQTITEAQMWKCIEQNTLAVHTGMTTTTLPAAEDDEPDTFSS